MLLYRIAPEGSWAVAESESDSRLRILDSDPFATLPGDWEYGAEVSRESTSLLAPVRPGKIVCVGRNYVEHAKELNNPMPEEPLLFLKAPSSLIGPGAAIVLPPESQRVEHEGEIAVLMRRRLTRGATPEEARGAVLGVTCANDVTARDLQRKDAVFARAKSFDTFCPVGPAIRVGLLLYASRMMTLEPGDLLLTGTPAGVGPLLDGDRVEVEISGVGVLSNPVEALRS
jgi:2-keto-4-pentenoate hydratase/2-oxohepta-3-ene-1,7-dioic acid hydratase in catechol pathway